MKTFFIMLGVLVVGAFGYYFISPFFNTITVNDELPAAEVVPQGDAETTSIVSSGFEDLSPEQQEEMLKEMDASNADGPKIMNEDMPTDAVTPAPQLFPVMGTIGHPAEGTVRVIDTAEGKVIRFENFSTINGPRLNLYLAKDLDADEFIDLGPIRGTEGNINYLVPEGVDLSEYRYVMHWCVPFGVLFNYADFSG